MVVEVKSNEEFTRLIEQTKYKATIVDFTAAWCPPCRMIKPYFEELSTVYTDMQFLKVDVDALADLTAEANIQAMPTFVIYKNGTITDELVRGADKKALHELIKKHSNIIPPETPSSSPPPSQFIPNDNANDHSSTNETKEKKKNKFSCSIL